MELASGVPTSSQLGSTGVSWWPFEGAGGHFTEGRFTLSVSNSAGLVPVNCAQGADLSK